MPTRRILSVWFPRLGAERLLRRMDPMGEAPFAVVRDTGQMQVLSSLSTAAGHAGLRVDQPLRDAHAMCPDLVTRLQSRPAETAFLQVLARWATQFSPWVATQPPDTLVLDVTGCAHLFGGEIALIDKATQEAASFGVTAQCGLADTLGTAWALARFAGHAAGHGRNGDAIDQEARATRSRATKRRHWERGGATQAPDVRPGTVPCIAPPGQSHGALAKLPVAALRLDPEVVTQLTRLGLRHISDLTGRPRAPLARRFGPELVLRLDQALGLVPEPISPGQGPVRFATRLALPDPIGLRDDILAALDRLTPRLCTLLRDKGQGARRVRLQAFRVDDTTQWIEIGLAQPTDQAERIQPLLAMKLDDIDAGFGIDMLRLEAVQVTPLIEREQTGHIDATRSAQTLQAGETADLISRIGARIGLEVITRQHPANSHIPEKSAQILAAAWSKPAGAWPKPAGPRPLMMWRPEPVSAPDHSTLSARFRWRGQFHDLTEARGPERIAPEWWLDEPDWRSGVRDYWRVATTRGDLLWLFFAHGAALSPGWFCHGRFA